MEAFACMDKVSVGLMGVTANTIGVSAFLRRKVDDVIIVVNPAKTVAPPPSGHIPTAGGDVTPGKPCWLVSRSAQTHTCWSEQWK